MRSFIAVCALVILWGTSLYAVEPIVIDFEGFPENTRLDDEYAERGVFFDSDGTTSGYPESYAEIRCTPSAQGGSYGFSAPRSGSCVLGTHTKAGSRDSNSAGIVGIFDPFPVTEVTIYDTDDDGTTKRLFAFDENGDLIAMTQPASRVPHTIDLNATGGVLIHSVEFDTQPGSAGGANDGTFFTIDDFTFVPADMDDDGIGDIDDNCPEDPNEEQSDRDLDGVGDACDCAPNNTNEPGEDGECPQPCGGVGAIADVHMHALLFLLLAPSLLLGFQRRSLRRLR